jgi:LysM repeat protein/ABC-type branched-subunit amino acid transport system substrate-binding protein
LKGLTSGDAIRVPKPHQEKKADSSYYYHVVKQGETIYGISKKYGVSIDSILAKNKKIQNNKISINDTLIIHYYHNIYNFIEYKPENKEALIDIANRFQISLNELQQKNPHLRKTASKNEIVFIPIKQQTPAVIMVQKQRTASPEIFNELVQTKDSLCIGGKDVNKTFTVALILPFSSRSISGQSRSTHKTTEANTKFRYVAFYNGFRMALDSIAAQGFNITLNVYDVTDVLQMEQLLEKPDMKKTDLIFCITYSELFTKLADFSRQYQIPLINIASHRNEILTGYPDVAKLFPDETDISKSIQQIIADNHQFNFIVVRKNNTAFQNIVQNLKIVYPNVKEHFTEGKGAASIEKMLNSWNKNYVLILGDNKVEILDVMRFLSEKRKQYDVTLVGYPNWNEIQELEYRYAQELKLHIIAPYVVDDNLQLVKNFVYLYRARFNDEPSYFSFQGYDIAIHFITSLGYFGKKCLECSNHLQDNLLSTEKFLLQNTSGNGYNNNYWDIYTFDNYQIIRLEN